MNRRYSADCHQHSWGVVRCSLRSVVFILSVLLLSSVCAASETCTTPLFAEDGEEVESYSDNLSVLLQPTHAASMGLLGGSSSAFRRFKSLDSERISPEMDPLNTIRSSSDDEEECPSQYTKADSSPVSAKHPEHGTSSSDTHPSPTGSQDECRPLSPSVITQGCSSSTTKSSAPRSRSLSFWGRRRSDSIQETPSSVSTALSVNTKQTRPDFKNTATLEYEFLTGFMPHSADNLDALLLQDAIEPDSQCSIFKDFVAQLQEQRHEKSRHEGKSAKRDVERDVERDAEAAVETVVRLVKSVVGAAGTVSIDDVDKLGYASQRVLVTPRDIFYRPALLWMAALFAERFEAKDCGARLHRMLTHHLCGMHGPSRNELDYICRIEDIPEHALPNDVLKAAGNGVLMAQKAITLMRQFFLSPAARYIARDMKDVQVRDLDPVPRTIEDVIESAVAIVLHLHHCRRRKSRSRFSVKKGTLRNESELDFHEKLVALAYDPVVLANFLALFANSFPPTDCIKLVDFIIETEGKLWKSKVRRHYCTRLAAFVYAAALQTRCAHDEPFSTQYATFRKSLSDMLKLEMEESVFVDIEARSTLRVHQWDAFHARSKESEEQPPQTTDRNTTELLSSINSLSSLEAGDVGDVGEAGVERETMSSVGADSTHAQDGSEGRPSELGELDEFI